MTAAFMRLLSEYCSNIYRYGIFPLVKPFMENRTGSVIGKGAYMNKGSRLEGKNYLGREVYISNVHLGYGSYIAEGSRLQDCRVGRYSSIGSYVRSAFGRHPSDTFVSTHPAFYSDSREHIFSYRGKTVFKEAEYIDEAENIRVDIGNDVWIGTNVTLLEGIKIGDGAIIAAGAVVTGDVEPYAIYGGVPAKKLKMRFDSPEDIMQIASSKWWEKSPEELSKAAQKGYFDDVRDFRI